MKKNDKISSYIKTDLENRELKPSHDTWDRIQARMDVVPTQQKSNFKWWLSAAVIAFFTVTTSVYLVMNQPERTNEQRDFVNHHNQKDTIEKNSTSIHSSETVLANNEKIDSSKKEVEAPLKDEKKAISHGKVQVAVNEESQQIEISSPSKKDLFSEKKEEIKHDIQQQKSLVANATADSIKVKKKKKNFVDPNMLLYSIENKENLKEQNQSRVVSIGFK